MKMLHHPYIIQLIEVMELDNLLFIAMEYASGGEVGCIVCRRVNSLPADHGLHRRAWEAAGEGSGQILPANYRSRLVFVCHFFPNLVRYMHSMNACHRDLKASNLLLDENLDIKIVSLSLLDVIFP